MARSGSTSIWSTVWAWPVGIAIGLTIGIPVFGAKGGVAFGVALAVAFAVGLGLIRGRKSSVEAAPGGFPARGDQRDHLAQGATDGSATGVDADGSSRP
ncbi:hypothetical protein [Micromonospora chokoriensis]|uniref:Uncharacterized protein n=1 Tax=Micromonospora chokoriensis TaxID=356851 RepID=A0A1C4UB97_9ACTN|nr:hypothetical protein [Micromonospora chokoriensis]SCE68941.1 hypothetical protein GA0070612_0259 [Micromonospora chokoriensis]